MIAQQVAGKAVRDAVFLSNYKAVHLPHAMALGAALSLVAAAGMPPRGVVMAIEIDRVKAVSEGMGAIAGERFLKDIASRIKESLGPADILARAGSDEFALLLENCPRQAAHRIALSVQMDQGPLYARVLQEAARSIRGRGERLTFAKPIKMRLRTAREVVDAEERISDALPFRRFSAGGGESDAVSARCRPRSGGARAPSA